MSDILDDLDWQLAGQRLTGSPHTIWQILNHLIYWQDFSLQLLDGVEPSIPEHAVNSWPGGDKPTDAAEWQEGVLGSWPPPSGGDTR